MESQSSQTVLKHTKQGTKQRELQVNLSEYYPLSRDTSLRYGIGPTPLQKVQYPRSVPIPERLRRRTGLLFSAL